MKIKRITAVLLSVIMTVCAAAGSAFPAAAESPSGCDAVVSLYNNGALSAQISCKEGDIITVNTLLDTSQIDSGRISGVEGRQTFSSSLTLTDELEEEESEISDEPEYIIKYPETVFPVMGDKTMGSVEDNTIYFVGSNMSKTNPFIFDGEDGRLIVTTYRVNASGASRIDTDLTTLARRDDYLTKIISRSVVKEKYIGMFTFSSGLAGNSPHALIHAAAAAPTQTENGRIEYWQCENCGAYFADESCENEITQADTVIAHQYVVGNTISLKDEIGVNFYLSIPDCFDDLTVKFNWGTGSSYQREADGILKPVNTNGANYKTACLVAARCMTDKVHMSVKNGEDEILTYDYSITDYSGSAAAAYANNNALKNLLCYMLEYGAAVQRYFGYKTEGSDADLADSYIGVIDPDWSEHRTDAPESLTDTSDIMYADFSEYGINFEGTTLVATSATAIRLFFTVTDSTKFAAATASCSGRQLAFKDYQGGRMKYIELDGISAKNTFDENTVTFSNGSSSVSCIYTAANYYNSVMDDNTYDVKTKNAVRAMYNYSNAAKAVLS